MIFLGQKFNLLQKENIIGTILFFNMKKYQKRLKCGTEAEA